MTSPEPSVEQSDPHHAARLPDCSCDRGLAWHPEPHPSSAPRDTSRSTAPIMPAAKAEVA